MLFNMGRPEGLDSQVLGALNFEAQLEMLSAWSWRGLQGASWSLHLPPVPILFGIEAGLVVTVLSTSESLSGITLARP